MVDTLVSLNRQTVNCESWPTRVVQFGTGNFLKGFFNAIVQKLNQTSDFNSGIVAVKLRQGREEQLDRINDQDGLFSLNIRGYEDEQLIDHVELISCQNAALSPYRDYHEFMVLAELEQLQWVVSNATEAGICFQDSDTFLDSPPSTFPAKLTQLLYRRYRHFEGDVEKGLAIFCCELIVDNAAKLREVVLQYADHWQFEEGFSAWLKGACEFYNTLVDRIVTGCPSDQRREELQSLLPYRDREVIETEGYYQWVIESPEGKMERLREWFPEHTKVNVVLTDDLAPYRKRKVRILNGAHTGCVAIALLLGHKTVYQATQDPQFSQFMAYLVYNEICPTIDLPQQEVAEYAAAILKRFENPYLEHQWQSIALNSFSKWQMRLLPVLRNIQDRDAVPFGLSLSLATLLLLYRGDYLPEGFELQDDEQLLATVKEAWQASETTPEAVARIFRDKRVWDGELGCNTKLIEVVGEMIVSIEEFGLSEVLRVGHYASQVELNQPKSA